MSELFGKYLTCDHVWRFKDVDFDQQCANSSLHSKALDFLHDGLRCL